MLSGTTVLNIGMIAGNSTYPYLNPQGIVVVGTVTDSIIVTDSVNNRVIGLWNVGTSNQNISVVAVEWAPGQPLQSPTDLYIDTRNGYNLYVGDSLNGQVVQYTNIQSISPPPNIVAGTGHVPGTGLDHLSRPFGIAVDSQHNVIVTSRNLHRITFWPPNATNSTVIAGLSIPDGTSMGLNYPSGIAFDERNSWLYVADMYNHRIQRYSINGTWPCNGTTVAGGNGPGNGSHQLYQPTYIKIIQQDGSYVHSRLC